MELTENEIYRIISNYIRYGLCDDSSLLKQAIKQANGKDIMLEFIFWFKGCYYSTLFIKDVKLMLNERQKQYCIEFVRTGNQTQSYKKVYGTSTATSRANSSKLMKSEEVLKYIEELNSEKRTEHILQLDDCLRILTEIAEDSSSTKNEKMKAIDMRLKTLGVYLQRMKIDDGIDINVTVEDEWLLYREESTQKIFLAKNTIENIVFLTQMSGLILYH